MKITNRNPNTRPAYIPVATPRRSMMPSLVITMWVLGGLALLFLAISKAPLRAPYPSDAEIRAAKAAVERRYFAAHPKCSRLVQAADVVNVAAELRARGFRVPSDDVLSCYVEGL